MGKNNHTLVVESSVVGSVKDVLVVLLDLGKGDTATRRRMSSVGTHNMIRLRLQRWD